MFINRAKAFEDKVAARSDEIEAKSVPLISKCIKYAKDNPSDVMLGMMTLILMDIETDVDDLEELTNNS